MKKDKLINEIVEIEKEMFVSVRTEGECACQADIDSFTFHRKVQFVSWDEATLALYLAHIKGEWGRGVNLMTIKYARMEDQIPPYSSNPLIPKIMDQTVVWQKKMKQKYPRLMSKSRPITDEDAPSSVRSFRRYFSGELETYSDDVLESLYRHVQKCIEDGVNMSIVSYEYMVKTLGYKSIAHADSSTK